MKRKVGIPIAFEAEAWCLLGARRWRRFDGRAICTTPLHCGVDIVALRSGVGRRNGLQSARWLIGEGAEALVSIGVAGGLHPKMETGELVVGDRIMEERAGEGYEEWKSDLTCTKLAHLALLNEGIHARKGSIVSVKEPVLSSRKKHELYERTHALVSDMESGSIARAAAESQVPFLALRVVIDPPQKNLEPALSGCLDDRGRVRFPLLWRNLCRRPSLLPELLRMTSDLVVALSALRRGWNAQIRHTLPAILRS